MGNRAIYYGVIVIGIVALVIGILYTAQVFGLHPVRGPIVIAVGVILLIAGAAGLFMARTRS